MSPEDEKEADAQMELIENAFRTLSEHFDTVSIFATRHISDDRGTLKWTRGGGNWYARYGQVREWVLAEESRLSKTKEE
jgi:hypothetical protein